MSDTTVAAKEAVASPEKKVEEVEKKVEESAEEPTPAAGVTNGHAEEPAEDEEETPENGEDSEEKEAESTENDSTEDTEVSAAKRKSTGGDEADVTADGVSPEKKAKLADKEDTEASNGVETEATA